MKSNVAAKIAALDDLSTGELHERYAQLYGETTRSRHRQYLIRRVAWKLQAQAEGGLSQRALQRAHELADITDARVTPPKACNTDETTGGGAPAPRVIKDNRLPAVGNFITRNYKGRTIRVMVAGDGFEYEGERYSSLSAVAKQITGSHMNGFRFFKLGAK